MKNKLYALTAIVTAFALAACGGAQRPGELDPEGIGPVRLGMQIGEVPPQAEGWYAAIEIEHTDESYDLLDDEVIPAFDTYLFQLNGETMFKTALSDGTTKIYYLAAVSPRIGYKGIHPGMTVADALAAGVKCHVYGVYESCEFYCELKIDESPVQLHFQYQDGKTGFSKKGQKKLFGQNFMSGKILDVTGDDFQPDAVIESISINR